MVCRRVRQRVWLKGCTSAQRVWQAFAGLARGLVHDVGVLAVIMIKAKMIILAEQRFHPQIHTSPHLGTVKRLVHMVWVPGSFVAKLARNAAGLQCGLYEKCSRPEGESEGRGTRA